MVCGVLCCVPVARPGDLCPSSFCVVVAAFTFEVSGHGPCKSFAEKASWLHSLVHSEKTLLHNLSNHGTSVQNQASDGGTEQCFAHKGVGPVGRGGGGGGSILAPFAKRLVRTDSQVKDPFFF